MATTSGTPNQTRPLEPERAHPGKAAPQVLKNSPRENCPAIGINSTVRKPANGQAGTQPGYFVQRNYTRHPDWAKETWQGKVSGRRRSSRRDSGMAQGYNGDGDEAARGESGAATYLAPAPAGPGVWWRHPTDLGPGVTPASWRAACSRASWDFCRWNMDFLVFG